MTVASAAIRTAIRTLRDDERAVGTARYFKTAPGDYGYGDKFLGIRVPDLRKIARAHRALPLGETLELLTSPWHEERLVALLLLVDSHARGTSQVRLTIHRAYLANTKYVNNWDLVDSSAGDIVGQHIAQRGTAFLQRLGRSKSLWERRIAMIGTFGTIKQGNYTPTVLIAEQLLGDKEDLIHKAVGWMLREAGARDVTVLRQFLDRHGRKMPRTALRYAIEHFSERERKRYLAVRAT